VTRPGPPTCLTRRNRIAGSLGDVYEWCMTASKRTAFHELNDYLALPRLEGLELSPDGRRLVTTVTTLDAEGTGFVRALWDIDASGQRPPRRLTRSAQGERSPSFTPTGDLLFTSERPDPERKPEDDPVAALWLLPADGGEARVIGERPGGIGAVSVASTSGSVLVSSMTMPAATTDEEDKLLRTARTDNKVSAILHSGYPIRYWDHDLGPDHPRLLFGAAPSVDERIRWRDLSPKAAAALRDCHAELNPNGTTTVTEWQVTEPYGSSRRAIMTIDVESGSRRAVLDDGDHDYHTPRLSPDGLLLAAVRERRTTPTSPPRVELVLVPLAGGHTRTLTDDWPLWPSGVRWTPDGAALIVSADENGRGPLFRVAVSDGRVTRLTGDDACYTDMVVAPDGTTIYALRSSIGEPPAPVRLTATGANQRPTALIGPTTPPELPGTVTEVRTTAADGTELRAWLAVPDRAATLDADRGAPLLLWVHGGPLNSWNCWHWRWNPWLLVARGYAVLLPDPALSTGYGQRFIARGWGRWGAEPYTDLMTITDAALARPDIDSDRCAVMGGSFGGYMANWIAGHTDRFAAIVSHASLWALDQFGPTTDDAYYWLTEMTAEMAERNSPHHHVARITTPMLVIHGNRDYRVPVGEATRLWYELMAQQSDPEQQPHRFLYFPDENHWVLAPRHSQVWYLTVFAFLDWHVHGIPFQVPDLL
jgi:dipeptidyl aminopeptidase/acylaminoacyl peptidase